MEEGRPSEHTAPGLIHDLVHIADLRMTQAFASDEFGFHNFNERHDWLWI